MLQQIELYKWNQIESNRYLEKGTHDSLFRHPSQAMSALLCVLSIGTTKKQSTYTYIYSYIYTRVVQQSFTKKNILFKQLETHLLNFKVKE